MATTLAKAAEEAVTVSHAARIAHVSNKPLVGLPTFPPGRQTRDLGFGPPWNV